MIYHLCEICNHLKRYKNIFSKTVFQSFEIIIHGILLVDGSINCKKNSRQMIRKKSSQALSYFLNKAKFSLDKLISLRLLESIKFALKQKFQEYAFFIIDDSTFKKKKYKKSQGVGVNYDSYSKSARRSQCLVMSSFIINGFHGIFKSMFYVTKKHIAPRLFKTKPLMAVDLLTRFSKFIKENKLIKFKWIVLIDGGYTNAMLMQYLASSVFEGFIGRYSKGRNIFYRGEKILLKKFISTLTLDNFKEIVINGEKKLYHELVCGVTGLDSVKMVLVIDDRDNPKLSDIRPLITNIKKLPTKKIILFYSYRWKQETYHQIIKESFGFRVHKIRKLSSLSRFFELLAISYTLLEMRRFSKYSSCTSVFKVKNDLVEIAKKNFILNLRGSKTPKIRQIKELEKFAA